MSFVPSSSSLSVVAAASTPPSFATVVVPSLLWVGGIISASDEAVVSFGFVLKLRIHAAASALARDDDDKVDEVADE